MGNYDFSALPVKFMDTLEKAGNSDKSAQFVLILYGAVLLFAIIGAFRGYQRGIFRQLVSCVTVAAAVPLAYILCQVVLGSYLTNLFAGKTMAEALEALALTDKLAASGSNLSAFLLSLDAEATAYWSGFAISYVILPLAFLPVFLISFAVMRLVYLCLCTVLGILRGKNGLLITHLPGMVLGIAQGALIALVLIFPLTGWLNSAEVARNQIRATESETYVNDFTTLYDEKLNGAATSLLVDAEAEFAAKITESWLPGVCEKVAGALTGKKGLNGEKVTFVYHPFFEMTGPDGKTMDSRALANDFARLYVPFSAFAELDVMELTEEQQADIFDRIGDISKFSPDYTKMVTALTRACGAALADGNGALPLNGAVAELVADLADVWKNTNTDNVQQDVKTVFDVYCVLCNEGVLAAFGDDSTTNPATLLTKKTETGNTVAADITALLKANPRTAGLVSKFAGFSLSLLSDTLTFDGEFDTVYNALCGDIKDNVLSLKRTSYTDDTAYQTAVKNALNDALMQRAVTLTDADLTTLSQYVGDNFGQSTQTPDNGDVTDLLLYYFGLAK